MRAQTGAPRPADVEIRAVVDELDAWEVVSSARCCSFKWRKVDGVGTVYVDDARGHDQCRDEVREYAWRRRYCVERLESRSECPAPP